MTDKIKDKEIINGLKCHLGINPKRCPDCKYTEYGCYCLDHLHPDLLDLINRLQAENERLRAKIVSNEKLITNLITNLSFGSETYKYLTWDSLEILRVKTNAYKECIEKVKEENTQALNNNYKVRAERIKNNIGETDEFISYVGGKIDCLRGLDNFLDELLIEMKGQ